ncbi:hypothetical protein CHS0354_035323 [Potamilus streckersoni]|uniref:Phosphoenolpyruvate-protein phosphotransferase n=1 Tax=Potamilus streckersoni TaxID=2493646 RepID=A0AAE0S2K7_9BIVA|nr:hypothetical protein CHS0354_035323 [Potamilus streckersoni]
MKTARNTRKNQLGSDTDAVTSSEGERGHIPLIVDLDNTFLRTDLFFESVIAFVKKNPLRILIVIRWLLYGLPELKYRLAEATPLNIELLPVNPEFMDFLKQQKKERRIMLFTGATEKYARQIAEHYPIFDSVHASTRGVNFTASKKITLLKQMGIEQFDYAGDRRTDMKIFRISDRPLIVNPSPYLRIRCKTLNGYSVFDSSSPFRYFFTAIKPLYWLKNVQVILPMMIYRATDITSHMYTLLTAFIVLCFADSALFVVHALLNVQQHRAHSRKKHRPVPAGKIGIGEAVIFCVILLLMYMVGIYLQPSLYFTELTVAYIVCGVLYSFISYRNIVSDMLAVAGFAALPMLGGFTLTDITVSSHPSILLLLLGSSVAGALYYIFRRSRERTGSTTGVVIGKAYNIYSSFSSIPRFHLTSSEDCEAQIARLSEAREAVLHEIRESEEHSTQFMGEELVKIFETHRLILNDRQILPKARQLIESRQINAEWALNEVIEKISSEFRKIQDNYIKSRFNDIRQVLERVMDFLQQKSAPPMFSGDEAMILIKEDFSPTEITALMNGNILGIATEYGGEKSHTAIMCQSLGIPLIVGLSGIIGKIPDFEEIILDTETCEIIRQPDTAVIQKKRARIEQLEGRRRRLKLGIDKLCILKDGTEVSLEANVDFIKEAQKVKEYNISGIGLLRSEILFMSYKKSPSEEEQYRQLRKILTAAGGKPVTVRTWDLGADKSADFFPAIHNEVNPALGLRAIRICLREPEFFKTQLRPLVRLSAEFQVKILLPMISGIHEITRSREYINEIADEMGIESARIKVGSMVETPAAAINIEEVLEYSDFISIGSNDLVQYTLGIDRANEYVSHLYTPYHPSVIKILDQVIKAANFFEREVVVCGEIPATP